MLFTISQTGTISWQILKGFLLSEENILLLAYCYLVGFIYDFIKEIDLKFGPGNLVRMLSGEFHKPKEVERIFMFLDLKSSTTIAEKLGHFKYSQLIQDCFSDLYIVEKYRAEVYQYVGDEVVLTWKKKHGFDKLNSIETYFAFRDKINSRSDYYM